MAPQWKAQNIKEIVIYSSLGSELKLLLDNSHKTTPAQSQARQNPLKHLTELNTGNKILNFTILNMILIKFSSFIKPQLGSIELLAGIIQ